jgi:fibronectin type 3 domain-containing protein
VAVAVVEPPETPSEVTPVATAGGVKLTWSAHGSQFRVFRKPEGAAEFALAATVEQPEWTDAEAEFGKPTAYLVQTVVTAPDNRLAESDLSAEVSIKPKDEFPPAVPSGLRATAGPASVELSWEPDTEPDLAGYRIYSAVGAGAFEKVADVAAIPTYSDKSAEKGKTYRYAVSAVDRAGNESARSAPVEAVVE